MWPERDRDRERSTEERLRRIRGESAPEERTRGYWIFVSVLAVLAVLGILLLVALR